MKPTRSGSLLLAYYGDDFTGSTDVLEALSIAGLRTALFVQPPTKAQLAKFPGLKAFGIAGGSRTMSPQQMNRALPPAFKALKASGARFVHYKTCSTFDSSADVGSIGRAIELGRRIFGPQPTPLVVGVPVLGRFVVFGNLFARSGLDTEPARLDRHPTMSRHPVTPMDEPDLRIHLAKQTTLPVQLVDVLKLEAAVLSSAPRNSLLSALKNSRALAPIVLFDTLRDEHLSIIGRCIADLCPRNGQLFCAGSSGIEYALTSHWRDRGLMEAKPSWNRSKGLRGPLIVISGSCSPVTDRQIGRAVANGFVEITCDVAALLKDRPAAVSKVIARTRAVLNSGRHIIFHTARGSTDRRREPFQRAASGFPGSSRHEKMAAAAECLSNGLSEILEHALRITGPTQAVVCGGDTSTHVARRLGVEALEFIAPAAPGAPRCRIHAPNRIADGCAIVFKGGQVGADTFFEDLFQ